MRKEKIYTEVARIYGENISFIHKIVKEKEIPSNFAVPLQTEKLWELHLQMEDISRKHALIDSIMLHQTAWNLHEDFNKGSTEMNDTKPFTRKGWLDKLINRFGWKI